MYRNARIAATTCVLGLGLGAVGQAGAASHGEGDRAEREREPRLQVVHRPAKRFDRSIETHLKLVERRGERREESVPGVADLGVSQATLDAIASCESGGDPTAVNSAGYYGKYQFDLGTWASVGGTGNPADAPEAEQDYRAALLYQRAGSSPWPVCG
ncbi:MAG: transglycosylase family protein [Solirubrobacterales bacterium]